MGDGATPATPAATPAAPAGEGAPAAGATPVPAAAPATPPAATAATPAAEPHAVGSVPPAPPVEAPAFKVPEGLKPDDAGLAKIGELAKAKGFNPEQAQAAVDFYAEQQKAANEAGEKYRASLGEKLKVDTEFGGANLEASRQIAKKALAKIGDAPDIKELVDGLGDHPGFVRILYRFGKLLSEDSIGGADPGAGDGQPMSREAFLRAQYPTMYQPE